VLVILPIEAIIHAESNKTAQVDGGFETVLYFTLLKGKERKEESRCMDG